MTDDLQQDWIKRSALYLRQLEWRDDFFDGRLLSEGQAQTLREEVKQSLVSAYQRAKAVENELRPIICKIKDSGLLTIQRPLREAWNSAVQTSVSCALALEQLPGPRTREKRYHLAAARLAVAMDQSESAREITRRIIREAGLDENYSEASLTNWLRKARDTHGFENLRQDPK